jgi:cytochrome c
MRQLVAAPALALALSLASPARAEDRASTQDAERLVHKAVEFLGKEGKDKAFAVFSDPKGPFTYRDLYIFVIDWKGVILAHGTKKELVGKNDFNRKDSTGKLFTQDMIKIAQADGKGWMQYEFENPVTKAIDTKVAYFERVEDFMVGCGAFKKK